MSALGFSDKLMNLRKKNLNRPPFEGAYVFLLAIFIGFVIADLAIIKVRPMMFPETEPPSRPRPFIQQAQVDYSAIPKNNIFNSDGVIPPPLSGGGTGNDENPVPTTLPLQLMGTIVHVNPKKSVASIQVRGNPIIGGFSAGDDVEGLAEMVRVERRKAVFRNGSNHRLEFIDIKEESKLSFGIKPQASGAELIQQDGNNFNLNRSDVVSFLDPNKLNNLVMQARCEPNIVAGSGGVVEGFRCVAVQPGSMIEKLGIKPGYIIKKVNGEPINTPNRVISLLSHLKQASEVELTVERDGVEEVLRYQIK
jgi:general secretion pathway protein C